MLVIIWRGYGIIALFVLAFFSILYGVVLDANPTFGKVCSGFCLVAAGGGCFYLGRSLNHGSGVHHLYWIPLEVWGIIYMVSGTLFALSPLAD